MALDPREVSQLLAQAQIKLTGASEGGIKAELYDVLKEFFGDSSCWQEDIPFLPLTDQHEYMLAPAFEGQIIRLIGAWDDKGSPRTDAFMRDFATLFLVNAPQNDATADFTARVVKTVTLPITRDVRIRAAGGVGRSVAGSAPATRRGSDAYDFAYQCQCQHHRRQEHDVFGCVPVRQHGRHHVDVFRQVVSHGGEG
jgi:hypothetical protein